MNLYRLSREADRDIEAIARFTAERWGLRQAERYLESLGAVFELLSEHPGLGRRIDHVRAGYRRLEHRSHSMFYTVDGEGLRIVRVLHRSTLAGGRI